MMTLNQAELSDKLKRLEFLEKEFDDVVDKNRSLVLQNHISIDKITDLQAQLSAKEQECERLRTTLVAGAELIKENWDKLCDDEGYGPQNLLLRMDGTLNTSGYPGYSSGEFEKLRKRCEDLESAMKCNSAVLSRAFAVGEIRFKTCVLSASVHDNIVEVMKLNKELLSQ